MNLFSRQYVLHLMKLPTDLQILNEIYEKYYSEFVKFDKHKPQRDARIYVPIDIDKIGQSLNIDSDIIFGRLYYHLNNKYTYEKDGATIDFFALRQGNDIHLIQFPYMASILAEQRAEAKKHYSNLWISIFSLVIAVVSIAISIFT